MKLKIIVGLFAALLWPALALASPNFTQESGIKLSFATPYAVVNDTVSFRLYFTQNSFQILSATTTDNGVTWQRDSGVRVDTNTVPSLNVGTFTFTGAAVLPLTGGGYRMIFSVATSSTGWRIVSAISTDGVNWANETTPIFTSSKNYVGSPQLIQRSNGDWRLYFLIDVKGNNNLLDRQIYTSLSSNQGVAWTAPVVALADYASGIAAVVRSDQRPRLYLTRPLTNETTSSVVLSALATDSLGTTFNEESGVRLSTTSSTGGLGLLTVYRSSSSVQWSALYAYQNFVPSSDHIYRASTLDPDPQTISPSQVVRSDPAQTFTIGGEVFDSTPTVKLSHSGDTDIAGTSLVRNSDMSLSATFDTNNKTLGSWNLTVTNSDGHEATISNAVVISFLAGNVVLTDNLLRPNTGARTRIDIDIFDAGDVKVVAYTLDGRLVNTLYHASTSLGRLTLYWDGKTNDGNIVASGVYFLKIEGPKLDVKQKVVVIR